MQEISVPSLAPSNDTSHSGEFLGLSRSTWLKIVLITAAFVLLYWPNLNRLWHKTNLSTGDRNWSHSMLIPIVGLYYLFLHRDQLKATPIQPILGDRFTVRRFIHAAYLGAAGIILYLGGNLIMDVIFKIMSLIIPIADSTISLGKIVQFTGLGVAIYAVIVALLDWGIGSILAGIALSAYALFIGRNDFINDVGMVVTLFGVVLTLAGWKVMRITWFPIAFLICALPWPPLVYSAIALPLQKLAAIASVKLLNLFDINAEYSGTKIFMPIYDPVTRMQLLGQSRALNVAEACAGMVALMTFITIATTVAFLSSRPMWQKVIIIASAVPIAIFCNVLRVAGVGTLDLFLGQEWSEGFAHQFTGMVLMLPAFLLILLVCWILDHLFIEESEENVSKPKSEISGQVSGEIR